MQADSRFISIGINQVVVLILHPDNGNIFDMEPQAPIVLLIVSLLIGVVLQHIREIPDNASVVLNQYLIYAALPALALIHVPGIEISPELLFPMATSWIVYFGAVFFVHLLSDRIGWDRGTVGCIILTAGLGNIAFVGFPVIEALYGAQGLRIGLLVDQPGTFVAVSVFGVITASMYSKGPTRKRDIFRDVITFPPFIFFMIAVLMNVLNVQTGGVILGVLNQFAATLTPVALISVGLQLKFRMIGRSLKPLIAGLTYKLILAPLILYIIYVILLGGQGLVVTVSIMMAAMPPMVTGSILASTYGLNPRLASLMIGIGIPLSALTLAIWYRIL